MEEDYSSAYNGPYRISLALAFESTLISTTTKNQFSAQDLSCERTPFEHVKMKSIQCLMNLYILRGKEGKTPERYFLGVAVCINILEALMQEALLGTIHIVNLQSDLRESRGKAPRFHGLYRDRLKSMQILLSRTQPEPGRTGKQEQ